MERSQSISGRIVRILDGPHCAHTLSQGVSLDSYYYYYTDRKVLVYFAVLYVTDDAIAKLYVT